MRKRKWKRKVLVYGLVGLLLLVMMVISYWQDNFLWIEKPVRNFLYQIEEALQAPFVSSKYPPIDLSLSQERESEIAELKGLLHLKDTLTSFDLVYAMTIFRNVDLFRDTLTIDRGENDGIRPDMAVVTEQGLIGKIKSTTADYSEVQLLTASSLTDHFQVSVMVQTVGDAYFGVLNRYDSDKDLFVISGIPTTASIQIGNIVTTSGMGGVFPRGIYVGEVVSQAEDLYGMMQTVYVMSKQNFASIRYVAVLTDKE